MWTTLIGSDDFGGRHVDTIDLLSSILAKYQAFFSHFYAQKLGFWPGRPMYAKSNLTIRVTILKNLDKASTYEYFQGIQPICTLLLDNFDQFGHNTGKFYVVNLIQWIQTPQSSINRHNFIIVNKVRQLQNANYVHWWGDINTIVPHILLYLSFEDNPSRLMYLMSIWVNNRRYPNSNPNMRVFVTLTRLESG